MCTNLYFSTPGFSLLSSFSYYLLITTHYSLPTTHPLLFPKRLRLTKRRDLFEHIRVGEDLLRDGLVPAPAQPACGAIEHGQDFRDDILDGHRAFEHLAEEGIQHIGIDLDGEEFDSALFPRPAVAGAPVR